MKTFLNKFVEWIYIGAGVSVTIVVWTFAYQFTEYSDLADVGSWTTLTASSFNQLVTNVRTLKNDLQTLSWSVARLDVTWTYSVNRPDLWSPGVEINFGNSLYGKRVTGTISAAANTNNFIALASGASFILDSGWIYKIADTDPYNEYDQVPTTYSISNRASYIYLNQLPNKNITFITRTENTRTNCPYDVWVLYKK